MARTTMIKNYELLYERVKDSLTVSDLDYINGVFKSIVGPSIVTGSGGSYPVAVFLAKVLNQKNGIITEVFKPRDFNYKNIKLYHNVIACSYGGDNFGVKTAFNNELNKYLFSSNSGVGFPITYNNTIPKEYSFISLGSTLIPISIALNYYLNGKMIDLKEYHIDGVKEDIFEIITGYDTLTTSSFIETTMVESGIGCPVVHDKYDYCHGRTTLSFKNSHSVIYLDSGKELDEVIKNELNKYYKNVIILSSDYDDDILRDFDLLLQSFSLVKEIALKKAKDLSIVDYSPIVKKLYSFKGEM